MATKAFDALAKKHGRLLASKLEQVPEFKRRPLALARQLVRMSALLHDIGHAAFSHAAESTVNSGEGHEVLSVRIVTDESLLGGLLKELFGKTFARRMGQIIAGSAELPPQMLILKNLVSGEMDCDRTDYLLRDCYHCGVEYGIFDHRWMIECLELKENAMGGLEIALHRDGLHTFEALILARYYMNAHVYQHRIRRIYDYYLKKYFSSVGGIRLQTELEILANNDMAMLSQIFRNSQSGNGPQRKWAKKITKREHHRVIHETGLDADAVCLRRSGELLSTIEAKYPELDFVYDTATASIHKLYVPGDEKMLVDLRLIGSDGHTRSVGEESQVIRSLPRRFQCARIYCDFGNISARVQKEIRAFAASEWHKIGA